MDNTNSKLVEILNKIQYAQGVNLDEIAKKIGVTRPYLSKAKTSGNVDNLIGLLKEHYKEVLEPFFTVTMDRDTLFKELYERQERTTITVQLLLSMVSELEMKVSGRPLADVQLSIEKGLNERLRMRFEEQRNSRGGGQ